MELDAFQTAIFGRLTGSAIIAALSTAWGTGISPVFADTPQINGDNNAYYPYITFGQDIATPWDTKSSHGADVSFQVDVWSRSGNYLQVKTIAGLVYDRLHDVSFTITGADEVQTLVRSIDFTKDPDGETRRALIVCSCLYDVT